MALSLFPVTAGPVMVTRAALSTVPAWQVIVSLGLLALGAPLSLWASVKVFRTGLLLGGKPPALREVWRAWRQA